MAEIKPFRGILYSRNKVDIEKVVTPPYDVISRKMQNRFYHNDPHNIIRLILGRAERSDTKKNNKHTRAGKFLSKWLKDGILAKDRKPSIYVYTQEYLHKGKKRTRMGFVALMKIEDPRESGVLPHEYTLTKPKEDRLNLIGRTKANSSPIFSLFQDPENKVNKILKSFTDKTGPLFLLETEGVIHKIWRIDKKSAVLRIQSIMRGKKIFIADGHHRYEVALAYRNAMGKRKGLKNSMNYVMMYFSNLSERGNLTILSTHRVIRYPGGTSGKKIKSKLRKYFDIKKVKTIEKLFEYLEKIPRKKHAFGIYAGKGIFYLLSLKSAYPVAKLPLGSGKTYSLKKLDVTILHDLIIDKLLGVKNTESIIKYIRNEKDAGVLVDKGDYNLAFFLRPTDIMEMKAVAERGEMMPQKSTYFYPKLLTGLVVNKF